MVIIVIIIRIVNILGIPDLNNFSFPHTLKKSTSIDYFTNYFVGGNPTKKMSISPSMEHVGGNC